MKKQFNKIKTWLATLWIAIISSFSKVFGQYPVEQPMYGIKNPNPVYGQPSIMYLAMLWIKTIVLYTTLPIIFIIWIINLKKIKKLTNKEQKKKIRRKTITTILIILGLGMLILLALRLLAKYDIV